MKLKYLGIALVILAFVLALSGCTGQGPAGTATPGATTPAATATGGATATATATATSTVPSKITGLGFKSGSWSTYVMESTGGGAPVSSEMTYKGVEVSFGGKTYSGMEMLTKQADVEAPILMLWESGKDFSSSLAWYAIKAQGIVMCFGGDTSQAKGTTAPPTEYDVKSDTVSLGSGTYTTDSGKTVNVQKYRVRSTATGVTGDVEQWVSEEVPFLMAKTTTSTTSGGQTMQISLHLKDFGLSGATSSFTSKELEDNCKAEGGVPGMGGFAIPTVTIPAGY
jgi:hypothetical protein